MAKVTIHIFQPIASQLGLQEVGGWKGEIEYQTGEPIEKVFERLALTFAIDLKRAILDPLSGKPKKGLAILLNGHNISSPDGLQKPLVNGDTISLIPAYGGGL